MCIMKGQDLLILGAAGLAAYYFIPEVKQGVNDAVRKVAPAPIVAAYDTGSVIRAWTNTFSDVYNRAVHILPFIENEVNPTRTSLVNTITQNITPAVSNPTRTSLLGTLGYGGGVR